MRRSAKGSTRLREIVPDVGGPCLDVAFGEAGDGEGEADDHNDKKPEELQSR